MLIDVAISSLDNPKSAILVTNLRSSLEEDVRRMFAAVRSPCRMWSVCKYAMPAAISQAVASMAPTLTCKLPSDVQMVRSYTCIIPMSCLAKSAQHVTVDVAIELHNHAQ